MDISLKDKVAIVTGASRGLGQAIAGAYAAAGASAMLSSRKQEGLTWHQAKFKQKAERRFRSTPMPLMKMPFKTWSMQRLRLTGASVFS